MSSYAEINEGEVISKDMDTIIADPIGAAWMRMVTIPNQSSVAKAFQEFDEAGRMRPSAYYDRIVDVMEELVSFTMLLRRHMATLTDRYSERKEEAAKVEARLSLDKVR